MLSSHRKNEPGWGWNTGSRETILFRMSIETLIALVAGFAAGIAATLGIQGTVKQVGWRTVRLWIVAIGIVLTIALAIVFVATQS